VGLIDDIGPGNVGIDTAVFIYFIEEAPQFLPTLVPLFQDADEGRRELIASAVTLLEVLVVPYRAGNHALAERYEALLTRSRGVRLIDLTRDQLRRAAQIRAATGARTPDALQVAAALAARCTVFVTNDRRLPTVPGLRIIQLAAYAA
jgi:predicted nucleic acid-binding protein